MSTPVTEPRPADTDIAYHVAGAGEWLPQTCPSPGEYRRAMLFWTRLIGTVLVVSALVGIALGIWMGVELRNQGNDTASGADVSGMSRAECLGSAGTTFEQCNELD